MRDKIIIESTPSGAGNWFYTTFINSLQSPIVVGVDWAKDSDEGGQTAINEIPRAYFQKEGKQ